MAWFVTWRDEANIQPLTNMYWSQKATKAWEWTFPGRNEYQMQMMLGPWCQAGCLVWSTSSSGRIDKRPGLSFLNLIYFQQNLGHASLVGWGPLQGFTSYRGFRIQLKNVSGSGICGSLPDTCQVFLPGICGYLLPEACVSASLKLRLGLSSFWYAGHLTCVSQGLIRKTEMYKGYFQKKRSNAGWLTKTFGRGMKDNAKCFWNSGNEEEQEFQETLINDPRCLHSGDRWQVQKQTWKSHLGLSGKHWNVPVAAARSMRSISLLPLNLA